MALFQLRVALLDAVRIGWRTDPVATCSMACSSSGMPTMLPRRHRHHRHAQFARQMTLVNLDAMPLGFVDQVERDDHAVGDFQDLQRQVEVAFQAGRVDDDDRHVRLAEQDEVAGDFFVGAGRKQRIGARQIDQFVVLVAVVEAAFGAGDGLARPVAGMLAQPGQGVEDRALAGIRVARQRDDIIEISPC